MTEVKLNKTNHNHFIIMEKMFCYLSYTPTCAYSQNTHSLSSLTYSHLYPLPPQKNTYTFMLPAADGPSPLPPYGRVAFFLYEGDSLELGLQTERHVHRIVYYKH